MAKYTSSYNPVLLGMGLLISFILFIYLLVKGIKGYITALNKPNITTKEKAGIWLSIIIMIAVYIFLIYLGIQYGIFSKLFALLSNDVNYN